MQGQRSTVDSLAKTIGLSNGSTSRNTGGTQSHFLNMSEGNLRIGSSSTSTAPACEWNYEATDNPLSSGRINIQLSSTQTVDVQNSGSQNIQLDLNLNCGYTDENASGGEATQEPGGSETGLILSTGLPSNPCGAGCEDGRSGCSSDGQRLSCKRKIVDGGVTGQLSLDASPNVVQHTGNRVPHFGASRSAAASSSSSISIPTDNPEQINAQLSIGLMGSSSHNPLTINFTEVTESSNRNSRLRTNSSRRQDLAPSNIALAGNTSRSNISLPFEEQEPAPFIPYSHTREVRPAFGSTSSVIQSHAMHIPGVQQQTLHFPWHEASGSRVFSDEEFISGLQELHSPTVDQNPLYFPGLAPDPSHTILANASITIPVNPPPFVHLGSSLSYQPFAPTWVPSYNPPTHYPGQLLEVPRPLSTVLNFGAHGIRIPTLPLFGPTAQVQETSQQGHLQTRSRPILSADRPEISFAPPALTEERNRLLLEIRNAIGQLRRDVSINLEEFSVNLNQILLLGLAEINDLHREMRLEIDDMSYEELLALEDQIGNVNTGLDEDTIDELLKQKRYPSNNNESSSEVQPCCICQEEFNVGEVLGALDCGHDYHAACIKLWLKEKNSCPICKAKALEII